MNALCCVTFSLLTMAGPFWLVSDCTLTRGGGGGDGSRSNPRRQNQNKIKVKNVF